METKVNKYKVPLSIIADSPEHAQKIFDELELNKDFKLVQTNAQQSTFFEAVLVATSDSAAVKTNVPVRVNYRKESYLKQNESIIGKLITTEIIL